MLNISIDKKSEAEIHDMAALLRSFPKYSTRAITSALKSEGYRLMGTMKSSMYGGPAKFGWPKKHPKSSVMSLAKKRYVRNFKMQWQGKKGSKQRVKVYGQFPGNRRGLMTPGNPLIRLAGLIRYKYDPDTKSVHVGFVTASQRIQNLVKMHAKGFETPVTKKSRKLAWAMGMPLKKTTTRFKSPARPFIDPVYEREKDKINENVRQKYLMNVMRYMAKEKGTA